MYKLIICDDEALERAALRKIVERRYPNISILDDAKTGEEVVRLCRLHMPDFLLMDIKMPELSGLGAQKKILEFHPHIQTIIITAHSNFSYAHEAIKFRIMDLLLKPVPPEELYESLDKLIKNREESRPPETEPPSGSAIRQALEYMETHYLDGLRIAEVAARVNLSEKYFSRFFKQHTGKSFTDHLNQLLVNRAKSLLLHGDDPIYKIAMDLNFSDAAYFSKVFRKYAGASPSAFRKQGSE